MRPPFKRTLLIAAAITLLGGGIVLAQNAAIDLSHLPLGDGHISDAPQTGSIWACHTDPGAGGAQNNGPWIHDDGTYDLNAKTIVQGKVSWPSQMSMTIAGANRIITMNGLPHHLTGIFPVQPSDPAYAIDRNPNSIKPHDITLQLPLTPQLAAQASCVPGAVGVLFSGAPLFNALDAPGRDAVAHEVQDLCAGHPERTGDYHYHSLTPCLKDVPGPDGHSALMGYALDGFGIYGHYGENGKLLTSADLDECHGHTHAIMWDGKMVTMYHYHATYDFPYTVGCMKGTVHMNDVMAISGGAPMQGGMMQGGMQGRPPPPDLAAAAQKLGIPEMQLRQALGPPPPNFEAAAQRLGISSAQLRQALGVP